MKKFALKLFIFLIPLIIIINLPDIIPITFHDDLNRKINTFIDKENIPDIIIAGDSRAERQLIPSIFEERLQKSTVNIAVNSGDITMLYNALKKNKFLNSSSILLVSISSIECNDNVVNKWGIPHAAVANIPERDNLKLFGEHYLNMINERVRIMFSELFLPNNVLNENDLRMEQKGFLGIDGDISDWKFETIDLMEDTLKVGWYLNGYYDGARKKVFKKTVENLSKSNMNIILFQPPVSPSWHSYINKTFIDSIEQAHGKFLTDIANQYDNISFIDFYENYNKIYLDRMFYNSIHFNKDGAKLFTNIMIDSLLSRNLIKIQSNRSK